MWIILLRPRKHRDWSHLIEELEMDDLIDEAFWTREEAEAHAFMAALQYPEMIGRLEVEKRGYLLYDLVPEDWETGGGFIRLRPCG